MATTSVSSNNSANNTGDLSQNSFNSSINNESTNAGAHSTSLNSSSFLYDTSANSYNKSRLESATSRQSAALAELEFGKMKVDEVYQLAREFIKSKGGSKAVPISYNDRNMMNVLAKVVNNYKLEDEWNKIGILDLVGKDRITLWKSLGDVTREDAMKSYISLVNKVCPLFYAHFEAHKRHLDEQEEKMRKLLEEEERRKREMTEQKEKKLREEDLRMLEENKKKRDEIQRKQIQEALNQQTYPHFKAYSEQQHPGNIQAQEELIKQLQEQHFEQYMNQVYQQQLMHQQQQAEQLRAMKKAQKRQGQSAEDSFKRLTLNQNETGSISSNTASLSLKNTNETLSSSNQTVITHDSVNVKLMNEHEDGGRQFCSIQQPPKNTNSVTSQFHAIDLNLNNSEASNLVTANLSNSQSMPYEDNSGGLIDANPDLPLDQENDANDDEDEIELPPISAASMITRKDVKDFKDSVKRDNDAIIKVGSGETVTVRVPTHEDGRLIFWEFASDYYDIGFGLYFEWTISPSNNVTVHVSDSSEDEEADEESGEGGGEGAASKPADIEKGNKSNENKPPVDEIIPIFRRDCHDEVYAGSHLYPGRGVYLLKFDNSYSLWRSKTLYYRVYYSK